MIRIAAIADLHCREECPSRYRDWYRALNDEADVFILGGDLTHLGKADEARSLAAELSVVRIPVLAVLGNHDVHVDRVQELKTILRDAGVWILDDGTYRLTVNGHEVGFAGGKGFGGGFGTTCLTPFGETPLKAFIHETMNEANKLERGLTELNSKYRVVVLHYAPVRDTLAGEPTELYPFLGSSLLCDPIDRLGADLILHGHAHHGVQIGQTEKGIPVRNVAQPVLKKYYIVYELGC